jgi:ABC-type nitrate/sulfonate/bicarbonate transport system substrate-binding protein
VFAHAKGGIIVKKLWAVLVLSILAVGIAFGSGSSKKGVQPLRIGTMPLTVGVPVAYADAMGYYKAEGLDVEILIFSTGAPINEAYAAGQIDIAVSGLASVYSLSLPDTHWIGEINTTGGLGIYVRPNSPLLKHKGLVPGFPEIYGSPDTFKGIKILGPLGTVAQYMAQTYAQKLGLSVNDYVQVHMEYGPAYSAFVAGEGDAVALNPPFSFQAEEAGYICAAKFEDTTGAFLVDGIFTNDKTIKNRREDVVKFIRATYRAAHDLQDVDKRYKFSMKWFNDNGKEYDDKSLRAEIAVRDYIDKDFMSKPNYVYGKGMKQIADFYGKLGTIEAKSLPNVVKSFDPSFINQALGIKFTVQK